MNRILIILSAAAIIIFNLPNAAFAVAPNFVFSTDTVYDSANNLTWTRDANTPGPAACLPGGVKYLNWATATGTYINCLNSNTYLGYNDWRVPTIDELRIFPDNALHYNDLNASGFVNVQSSYYWSGSTYSNDTSIAWNVSMGDGNVSNAYKTYGYYVWPVRGGQSGSFGSLPLSVTKTGTGSGTVTSSTGSISCGSTCSASLATGTTVTLTAAPSTGSTFAGWSGACSGTATTCSVSMTAAQSVGAAFNLAPVASNGSCGLSNGTTATVAPSSELCTSGSASTVSGTGPWSWSCGGSNGGSTASCSALRRTTPNFVFGTDTVYDSANNLTWTKDPNTPGPVACYPGITKDWSTATGTYINCLNSNNYLGYNDWRVPIIAELRNFTDNNLFYSQLRSLGFGTVVVNYWSSTTYDTGRSWVIDMTSGYVGHNNNTVNYYVWPVRSGQSGPSSTPTNGTCGSANASTVTTAPTTNLCTSGTPSSVTGTGPWSWTCSASSSNGGTNASCSANKTSSATSVTHRLRPQVLMGGFDPILLDLNDSSFKLFAVVRTGATQILTVQTASNFGGFSVGMTYTGTYANSDQRYETVFTFQRGAFPDNTILGDLFGSAGSQFQMSVIDTTQATHSFPDLEFGNHNPLTTAITSPSTALSSTPGIRRGKPQVLAAGFDPQLVDLSDTSFDIIAIVRQGVVPIQGVSVTQNRGSFAIAMTLVETLPNGDMKYKSTYTFPRGTFPAMRAGDLFGTQPGQFNITVTDQSQQTHSFPELRWGNMPAQ